MSWDVVVSNQLEHRINLLARLGPGSVVEADQPLAKRTTLRVGGKADLYVEPADEASLASALKYAVEQGLNITFLGRGSNLLIRDGGIRGMVVCLAQPGFASVRIEGEQIFCGAGARLKQVSVEARRAGLAGMEFLEGIPGSVGGALRMNAGAMGSWMMAVVEKVRFMDRTGRVEERMASEIPTEYRCCPLFKTHIAIAAVLRGKTDKAEEVAQRMAAYSKKRWDSQPSQPSAGCIFKNPGPMPAGKLIDELGLKGMRVGGARVSEVHGNFIVNEGGATAVEVLQLIEEVRMKVRAARGIELETEVEILGENPS